MRLLKRIYLLSKVYYYYYKWLRYFRIKTAILASLGRFPIGILLITSYVTVIKEI